MPTVRELLVGAGLRSRLMIEDSVGDGSTTERVNTHLAQQGPDADLFDGAWMVIDNGGSTFNQRAVKPESFDVGNLGARLEPLDTFEFMTPGIQLLVAAELPPYNEHGAGYSWLDAVNEGLAECTIEGTTRLTASAAGWQKQFAIPDTFAPGIVDQNLKRHIALAETISTAGSWEEHQNLSHNGYEWYVSGRTLIVNQPLVLSDTLRLSITGRYPHPHAYTRADRDDEVHVDLEHGIRATLWKAYRRLNSTRGAGKYNGEELTAAQDFHAWNADRVPRVTLRY